jgi:hypothetical protein
MGLFWCPIAQAGKAAHSNLRLRTVARVSDSQRGEGRIAKSKCLNRTRCVRLAAVGTEPVASAERDVLTIAVRQSGKAPSVVETVSGSNARLTALPANGLKELLGQRASSAAGRVSASNR